MEGPVTWDEIEPNKYLLADKEGFLHLLLLLADHQIRHSELGRVSPGAQVRYIDNRVVYAGVYAGPSSLLRITQNALEPIASFPNPGPLLDMAAVHGAGHSEKDGARIALDALKLTELYDKREIRAGELTLLDRKRMEIARALGTEPKLLLLDEVAAGLTEAEVQDVMKMVANLKAAGYSIIWIEHVIQTMVESTDTLMCMAEGHNLIVGNPVEVMNSKLVEDVYLGVEEDE